jgi:glutamate N-acetyltransferase/amino-acid N-acetyltransferase
MADAREMAFLAANGLNIAEEGVLVASTGVIGQRLPMEPIRAGTPALVAALRPDGFSHLAEAIMTTDTHPKIVSRQAEIGGVPFSVVGVAKGSGMIRPDMATMLCFVCTDLIAPPETLQLSLIAATHRSFNRITVDGDTSTNDTILLLANGASGADIEGPLGLGTFQAVLDEVLLALAKMVVRDGEGASKLAEIAVRGAASDADAACVAQTVANSNLVKTALFGEDANWGRIIAAVGRAGVPVEPERIAIDFNEVRMVEKGMGRGLEAEQAATEVLKTPEFVITIDLGMGNARDSVFTCDFSLDYVRINADYRS